jgi:glutamyl-tRNA(Gln) amidotransferase subunit E
MNSGVVEVKGVQQLDQLEKIIEYEAKRQHGLIQIGDKLKKLSITITREDVLDITEIFKDCESKIIQKALKSKAKIKVIRIRNFSGMFGFEPYSGIRLGKEIGQIVRFFGIGGVFHSDELPNYGINNADVDKVRKYLELADEDGFLIIAGEDPKLDYAIDSIIKRIQDATNGVPAETRAATQDGETIFLRPRPGASRMYPETDIPSISVIPEEIKLAMENIPKSWDESIAEIQKKYTLNSQLSEQIFDSEHMELFEKICENKKNSPNFVASILCSSITNLERKGLDALLLKPEHIIESFELLASGKIPKESLEIIFESIMSGKSENVSIAMQSADVSSIDVCFFSTSLDKIIQNRTFHKFLENWPEQKGSREVISVLKLNKSRKKMREALGMDLNITTEDAMETFWALGNYLEMGKVVKQKVHSDSKIRKKLLTKYKEKVRAFNSKLESEKDGNIDIMPHMPTQTQSCV